MIQILIPSIRNDVSGVLESLEKNSALPFVAQVIREGKSYAEAVNMTPIIGDWIMFAADDVRFYPNWDKEALWCHMKTGKMVIGTNDLHSPGVMDGTTATHWLVQKAYLEKFGGTIDRSYPLVYNYGHNYVDTEFIETAKFHNEFAYCNTSIVEHLNPSFGLAEMDEVYEKSLKTADADRALFESRKHLWSR